MKGKRFTQDIKNEILQEVNEDGYVSGEDKFFCILSMIDVFDRSIMIIIWDYTVNLRMLQL